MQMDDGVGGGVQESEVVVVDWLLCGGSNKGRRVLVVVVLVVVLAGGAGGGGGGGGAAAERGFCLVVARSTGLCWLLLALGPLAGGLAGWTALCVCTVGWKRGGST